MSTLLTDLTNQAIHGHWSVGQLVTDSKPIQDADAGFPDVNFCK